MTGPEPWRGGACPPEPWRRRVSPQDSREPGAAATDRAQTAWPGRLSGCISLLPPSRIQLETRHETRHLARARPHLPCGDRRAGIAVVAPISSYLPRWPDAAVRIQGGHLVG